MENPSLLDVARHAGVSTATVSRVLNGSAPVREALRARVLDAVAVVGYKASSSKRAGAPAGLGTIALLIADILNPFFSEVLRGIEDEVAIDEFGLSLFDTTESPQREKQTLQMLARRPVEGIIVCASRLATHDLITLIDRHRIPTVIINRRISHPRTVGITIDPENASSRAVRHLLDLGHSRIAYLAGPSESETSRARRRGAEAALAEAGLAMPPQWCPNSFPNIDGGFQAMSRLLGIPGAERPTAVVAYNDMMALGALHAIRSHDLRVPDDLSVVGFDDLAVAAHANPPLTTINQPKYRMGQLAMRMLRQMIRGEANLGGGYTLLESPLIIRESTAPPPAAGDALVAAATSRPPAGI